MNECSFVRTVRTWLGYNWCLLFSPSVILLCVEKVERTHPPTATWLLLALRLATPTLRLRYADSTRTLPLRCSYAALTLRSLTLSVRYPLRYPYATLTLPLRYPCAYCYVFLALPLRCPYAIYVCADDILTLRLRNISLPTRHLRTGRVIRGENPTIRAFSRQLSSGPPGKSRANRPSSRELPHRRAKPLTPPPPKATSKVPPPRRTAIETRPPCSCCLWPAGRLSSVESRQPPE